MVNDSTSSSSADWRDCVRTVYTVDGSGIRLIVEESKLVYIDDNIGGIFEEGRIVLNAEDSTSSSVDWSCAWIVDSNAIAAWDLDVARLFIGPTAWTLPVVRIILSRNNTLFCIITENIVISTVVT